ncbi:MAG: undecaprenyldiphospho-muramoylpentapeptide beta-N-acetylglucosaminyltransferase [Aquificaceae bacterium]
MILISGGGTGGHFFPALAIYEELTSLGYDPLFIGSFSGIEARYKQSFKDPIFLKLSQFSNRGIFSKVRSSIEVIKASLELKEKLKKSKRAISFGGYASSALSLGAIHRGLELFIHEQNSVPGFANSIFSKRASMVFITFESSKKYFPDAIKTGIPVRRSVLERLSLEKKDARSALKLEKESPCLLVMGGSQGSEFLNSLAKEVFSLTRWQGIHICGKGRKEELELFYKERGIDVLVMEFYEDMGLIYKACDVALSRAGAGSIWELSLFGLPAVFVPYPFAYKDHQHLNALEIAQLGGGSVLPQEKADVKSVVSALSKILSSREEFSRLIKTFSNPIASKTICEYLIS